METVLYEYHLDVKELVLLAMALLMGIAMWTFVKWNPLRVSWEKKRKSILYVTRTISVFCLVTFVVGTLTYTMVYSFCARSLENGTCKEVRGMVEKYNYDLTSDEDKDCFEIDGITFEYRTNDFSNTGYHTQGKDGGVITGNGQKLHIKYIERNQTKTILYIAKEDE